MLLNWFTALVKAAFLKGVQEAIEELKLPAGDHPDALEAYSERLALPSPAKAKGKKDAA